MSKHANHDKHGLTLTDAEEAEWLATLPKECCERCAYSDRGALSWRSIDAVNGPIFIADWDYMTCRRFPPVFVGANMWEWPDIAPAEWCGEYKERQSSQ